MRGHDLHGGQPHAWTRWRVTAAVLTTVLAAAACTNRGGTQPPTTSRSPGGVPDLPGPVRPDPNGTGVQGIFVIDLSGSHERQIQPPRGGRFPDWSPDGKRRTFSSQRDQPLPTWYLINPDGTDIHPLPQLQGAGDPIDWLTPVG